MLHKLLVPICLVCVASLAAPGCAAQPIGGASANAAGGMDDATITARVKTVLLNDTQVAATKIDVTTTGGIVALSGTVKTQAEAVRAVELAKAVTGVREVKSALQVIP
jgi:hyperosmotically inducible protein